VAKPAQLGAYSKRSRSATRYAMASGTTVLIVAFAYQWKLSQA
jgi:hypothetical protein